MSPSARAAHVPILVLGTCFMAQSRVPNAEGGGAQSIAERTGAQVLYSGLGLGSPVEGPELRAGRSGGGKLGAESTRATAPGRPQSGRLQPARRGVTRGGPATVTSSAVAMVTVHYK